jgi:RNA-directed DNA polymerase
VYSFIEDLVHWEERGRAKGNTAGKTRSGHSAGQGASSALGRVREVARRDRKMRFTALLHHVTPGRLRAAYWAISPKAAAGVDRVTWADYGQNLEANLQDLHERVQSGRYRARPSRRAYIPKADGRQRPALDKPAGGLHARRAVVRHFASGTSSRCQGAASSPSSAAG